MPIRVTFNSNLSLPPTVYAPVSSAPQGAPPFLSPVSPPPPGGRKPFSGAAEKDRGKLDEVLAELDALIGLESVKKLVHELEAFVEIQKRRTREKLVAEPLVLHMIFRGNPGTGKTTVARIIGKLFKELGVLEKGHMIECERADMVGEYIGHTAQKTREQIKRALGGVLFIDEAYSLARGGEKDFGKEAIDALVRAMENQRENIILILAGYKREMDWLLNTNPGLRSRFPIHIDFPDYTLDELLLIGESMFKQRQYELSENAKLALRHRLEAMGNVHPYSGNARLMRNLVEKTVRRQAVRLYASGGSTREELIQILAEDLSFDEL